MIEEEKLAPFFNGVSSALPMGPMVISTADDVRHPIFEFDMEIECEDRKMHEEIDLKISYVTDTSTHENSIGLHNQTLNKNGNQDDVINTKLQNINTTDTSLTTAIRESAVSANLKTKIIKEEIISEIPVINPAEDLNNKNQVNITCNFEVSQHVGLPVNTHPVEVAETQIRPTFERTFEPHNALHNNQMKEPRSCYICKLQFPTSYQTGYHVAFAHKMNQYSCSFCGLIVENETLRQVHINAHITGSMVDITNICQCESCHLIFNSVSQLRDHQVREHNFRMCFEKIAGKECKFITRSANALKHHRAQKHPDRPIVKFVEEVQNGESQTYARCSYSGCVEKNLVVRKGWHHRKHNLEMHLQEAKHRCKFCARLYFSKSSLKSHITICSYLQDFEKSKSKYWNLWLNIDKRKLREMEKDRDLSYVKKLINYAELKLDKRLRKQASYSITSDSEDSNESDIFLRRSNRIKTLQEQAWIKARNMKTYRTRNS